MIIDDDIPFIKGVLEPFCNVRYFKGGEIDSDSIANADALIIRTRTNCNRDLLNNSDVKSIFTATIGEDHIDKDYCKERGIEIYNAAGCNSMGVVQYVITSLFALKSQRRKDLLSKKIGIIGAGNVGEGVARIAEYLGFGVMRCDPPLESIGNNNIEYYDAARLLKECDIITMHVPLDKTTLNMCSGHFFQDMRDGAIFINTARGEIVDEMALIRESERLGAIVIDVWRDEPGINQKLLNIADIATPHIAGYSIEGKINATVKSVRNFALHYNITPLKEFSLSPPSGSPLNFRYNPGLDMYDNLNNLFQSFFRLNDESRKLKQEPAMFENLRSGYIYRPEFTRELLNMASDIIINNYKNQLYVYGIGYKTDSGEGSLHGEDSTADLIF